jgi:hypothetical protein
MTVIKRPGYARFSQEIRANIRGPIRGKCSPYLIGEIEAQNGGFTDFTDFQNHINARLCRMNFLCWKKGETEHDPNL